MLIYNVPDSVDSEVRINVKNKQVSAIAERPSDKLCHVHCAVYKGGCYNLI